MIARNLSRACIARRFVAVGEDTIERRRSLQLPEEARQWEREATLEQDNRIARVMMA